MDGKPLLQKVMEEGRTIQPEPRLDEIKARFSRDFHRLEDQFKALTGPTQYEVSLSPGLKRLNIDLQRELVAGQTGTQTKSPTHGEVGR
jgi:hypothetical protein